MTGDWSTVKMSLPDLGAAAFGQAQQLSTEPSHWQSHNWVGASPDRLIASGKALTEQVRSDSSLCVVKECATVRSAAVPCAPCRRKS